jgi:hypothetical protein
MISFITGASPQRVLRDFKPDRPAGAGYALNNQGTPRLLYPAVSPVGQLLTM